MGSVLSKKLVFVGFGSLNRLVAERLDNAGWQLHALRRNVAQVPEGILPISADVRLPGCPESWPENPDYILIGLAPQARTEEAYRGVYIEGVRNLLRWLELRGQQPLRIFFVSSTSVYGQSAGERVDEESVAQPSRWSGKVLLQAEELLIQSAHPVTRVRLAGIYGGRRQAFLQRVRQGWHADGCTNRITNRIHEQDAAALLSHLIRLDAGGVELEDLYLGVDDLPVEQAEVVSWLQQRLQVSSLPGQLLAPAGSSKRCINARARASGWQPCYTDYRAGYLELIEPLADA